MSFKTGVKNVVANVGDLVDNVWSDEARAAALEARKAGATGGVGKNAESATTIAEHQGAHLYHSTAAEMHNRSAINAKTEEDADYHRMARDAHQSAANSHQRTAARLSEMGADKTNQWASQGESKAAHLAEKR